MQSAAIFSADHQYRYGLIRCWCPEKPVVTFIGLNPSLADASNNDPTIRRCINFARSWGFGTLKVVNLFAYRTPYPEALKHCRHPIGPENDWYILEGIQTATCTIVAWGNDGHFRHRDLRVLNWIDRPYCLRQNKSGQPAHPLYIPAGQLPQRFSRLS